MSRYVPAEPEIHALVVQVRERFHPGLAPVVVAVAAVAGNRPIPVARARLITAANRAAGAADVLLALDAEAFERLSAAGKLAAIDHALEGVAVVAAGVRPAIDGAGRPRTRYRPFDLPGVGHSRVLKTHKSRSVEHAALLSLRDRGGRLDGDGDGPAPEAPRIGPKPKPKPAPEPKRPPQRPRPAA